TTYGSNRAARGPIGRGPGRDRGRARVTEEETAHLHVLAGTAPLRSGTHRREVRPSILALLERLPHTAGFVISATFEVLAWNALAAALMEDFGALEPAERNLARRAFLTPGEPEAPLYGISDAAEFRHHVVTELRGALARHPKDPGVSGLIEELRAGSQDFARLWERHDVRAAHVLTKTFRHPLAGEVTVDCDVLGLDESGQRLVLYSAPQASPSAEALAFLGVLGAEAGRGR
ncbi:DNA-binding protein, partial [Streptomyces sp. SPB78]